MAEEGGQEESGFVGEDAGFELGAVIEAGIGEDLVEVFDGAGLGIGGGVDDTIEAGEDDGAGAHDTGFEGDVEGAAGQSPVAEGGGGGGDGKNFGVGGRIVQGLALVEPFADNTIFMDDHGADRDFLLGVGFLRKPEGLFHKIFIGIEHIKALSYQLSA